MKKISIISILFSLVFTNLTQAKGFGKDDVANFCRDKEAPTTGKQMDGKDASNTVLNLIAGKYSYSNGGALLLFTNNYYIIKLPSNRDGIHGTSGDDLIASGGILGGCSKEQLSEAITNNSLNAGSFKLLKRYR